MPTLYDRADIYDLIENEERYGWYKRHWEHLLQGADIHSLLDVSIPTLTIPVKPGRNLAVIIEVAAMNNRNKKMGYNAALEFSLQVDSHIDQKYLEMNPK